MLQLRKALASRNARRYACVMERVAPPVDCDNAPRPVMIRAARCPSRLTIPAHSHRRSELVYVRSGTLRVTADDALFTVAPRNAILIPAGTVHDMRMVSDTNVVTIYIAPSAPAGPPERCRNLPISDLLRELMRAAADIPDAYEPGGRDAHVMSLIAAEVAWLTAQPSVPVPPTQVPKDARLLRVCRRILQELDRDWTIDDAATAAGMGRRTFTRSFRGDMGVSFSGWIEQARLNAAVGRLNAGASITDVAFESGYNSPSAFATMFKRRLGVSPSGFQAGAMQ